MSGEKSQNVQRDYLMEVRCPGYSVQWGIFLGGENYVGGDNAQGCPGKMFYPHDHYMYQS